MKEVKLLRISGIESSNTINNTIILANSLGIKIETTYLSREFALFDNTALYLVTVDGDSDAIGRFYDLLHRIPKIKSLQ